MTSHPIYDVFQKGLIRGSAHLPFDPKKAYAFVEHPTEGWRVYLRTCAFLHLIAEPFNNGEPFNNRKFLVVKRRGARWSTAAWEPPKGQMEGRDIRMPNKSIYTLLQLCALREIYEEAHITNINHLTHTGLVFQSQEPDYPANHFFQYHIFQGFINAEQVTQSFEMFQWMRDHPKAVDRWSRDRKEKDTVAWFDPKTTRLTPRWCPTIVATYLRQ
jgi:8-oxo-dGTP pyrophosphatase MutT (NUDIX family)